MKKIVYLLMIIVTGVFYTSCDPLEDINNELDAQENIISGDAIFTMEADDYKATGNEEVEDNESFTNIAQAELLIPVALADKYPVWGKASSAIVSFSLDRLNVIVQTTTYEVTDEDYDALGFNFGNFDSNDDFIAFLLYKYPNAVRGDLIDLTYQWWAPGVETRTDKFLFTDEWVKTDQFSSDDYTAMGQRFPNFSSFDTAEFRIGVYLGTLAENTFAESGDSKVILYTYTFRDDNGRQFVDAIANYTFDGSRWNIDANTITFGHNGTTWIKDNTIKYRVTADDIILVVDALGSKYPDATGNVGRFGSFDRRPSSGNYWDDDMLVEAFNVVLDNLDPSAADDQKYILTFATYVGSVVDESMSLIKQGGVWVKN